MTSVAPATRKSSCVVDLTFVCDNVRTYDDCQAANEAAREQAARCGRRRGTVARRRDPGGRPAGPDCDRRAGEGAARELLAVAARSRRAQRRQRADALAGRARGDEPDADGRRADRRGPGAAALPAAAPRRGRCRHGRARVSAPTRRQHAPRAPLRGADLLPARPARGALPPHPCRRVGPREPRTIRRSTSPAAARRLSSRRVGRAGLRRPAPRAERGRLRHLRRRPATPLREPDRREAAFLAVVSAGLRRS